MNNINSTDLLKVINNLSQVDGKNTDIDIQTLAATVDMSLSKLISVITELEGRDEIIVEIATSNDPISGEVSYAGTVRLMERPPDEKGL